jgi:YD repeat-containing protein
MISPLSRPTRLKLQCLIAAILAFQCHAQQQPVSFRYFYDDRNQLVKVVDSTGIAIEYSYDSVGNILQISRSTVPPGTLTIFNVAPLTVSAGGTVTILGQGFSPIVIGNLVTLNGQTLTVVSASSTALTVMIPVDAASGSLRVTVAGTSVTSARLTIQPTPMITSVSPKAVLAGTPVTLNITGANLTGGSFVFFPPLPATSASIDSSGHSATLTIQPPSTVKGYFTLVVTSAFGSSSQAAIVGFLPGVTSFNTISIPGSDLNSDADNDGLTNGQELSAGTDPLNGDTDSDTWPDGLEAFYLSNPLDPRSTPNLNSHGWISSRLFSVGNNAYPSAAPHYFSSAIFSVGNNANPGAAPHYFSSVIFSILNQSISMNSARLAYGPVFSINNTASLSTSAPAPRLANRPYSLTASGPDLERMVSRFFERSLIAQHTAYPWLRAPSSVAPIDSDGDGISDEDEFRLGTNATNPDTDGDGYPDGLEVALGSDPLDANSVPNVNPPISFAGPQVSVQNLNSNLVGSLVKPAKVEKAK